MTWPFLWGSLIHVHQNTRAPLMGPGSEVARFTCIWWSLGAGARWSCGRSCQRTRGTLSYCSSTSHSSKVVLAFAKDDMADALRCCPHSLPYFSHKCCGVVRESLPRGPLCSNPLLPSRWCPGDHPCFAGIWELPSEQSRLELVASQGVAWWRPGFH